MHKNLKTVIKIIVSVVLMALLLKISDPKKVFGTISGSDPLMLFAAFMFLLFGTLIAAYRWYRVMSVLNFTGNLAFYLKSYFMGVFLNQLLPSSIGGDAYRVISVVGQGYRKRDAFLGVLIDRGLGIVGIFIVNIVFNNMLPGLLPDAIYNTLNIISGLGIVGFAAFVFLHKLKFLDENKIFSFVSSLSSDLYKTLNSPMRFLSQFCLTVSVHILSFIGVYFIALSIGVNLSATVFMVIIPPVVLLTIIPISLAGWGIREGAMAGLMAFAGVSQELSVSISIIWGLMFVVQGAVGLFLWVKSINKQGKPK